MIICLGTTPALQQTMMFKRLALDAVNRAAMVVQSAAGKSINVAHVLHTLGALPLALGFVGGHSGKFIRDELDQLGIQHDLLEVQTATRTCVTIVDESAGNVTELVTEASPVPDGIYAELLRRLEQRIKGATALVLSGTLPIGAPADFYSGCVAIGSNAGVAVVLDAKGEALKRALTNRPTVVKPNRSELEETVGMKIDSDEAMKAAIRQLIALGPGWVVVTNGSAATVVSDGAEFFRVSTPSVAVASPIGSGDAFAAGLALGISTGLSVPRACSLGAACGAANAMTSQPGYLNRGDVEALISGITTTPF